MSNSPNPIDIYVGSRVRMRRLMLDLSQTELATALGISFQQVQKYEKGTNRISASRLRHIAGFLRVPIPFFFEGVPTWPKRSKRTADAHSLADFSQFIATADGLALIKAFTNIKDPKLRRRIVHLVEEAAGKGDRAATKKHPPTVRNF